MRFPPLLNSASLVPKPRSPPNGFPFPPSLSLPFIRRILSKFGNLFFSVLSLFQFGCSSLTFFPLPPSNSFRTQIPHKFHLSFHDVFFSPFTPFFCCLTAYTHFFFSPFPPQRHGLLLKPMGYYSFSWGCPCPNMIRILSVLIFYSLASPPPPRATHPFRRIPFPCTWEVFGFDKIFLETLPPQFLFSGVRFPLHSFVFSGRKWLCVVNQGTLLSSVSPPHFRPFPTSGPLTRSFHKVSNLFRDYFAIIPSREYPFFPRGTDFFSPCLFTLP